MRVHALVHWDSFSVPFLSASGRYDEGVRLSFHLGIIMHKALPRPWRGDGKHAGGLAGPAGTARPWGVPLERVRVFPLYVE